MYEDLVESYVGQTGAKNYGASVKFLWTKWDHSFIMSMKRKPLQNCKNPPVVVKRGRKKKAYTVDDAVKLVSLIAQVASEVDMVSRDLRRNFVKKLTHYKFLVYAIYVLRLKKSKVSGVNKITIDEALRAYGLQGKVTKQAVSYKLVKFRESYSAAQREGKIIFIPDEEELEEGGTKISSLTADNPASSSSSSSTCNGGGRGRCNHELCRNCKSTGVRSSSQAVDAVTAATSTSSGTLTTPGTSHSMAVRSQARTRSSLTRRSSRQAGAARLDAKQERMDYDFRFKCAFKEATGLLAQHQQRDKQQGKQQREKREETTAAMALRLNRKYNLNGRRKLTRSTLYRAVLQGKVGESSPCKKGPPTQIPDVLLDVVASHSEVCQVGRNGELRGKDFKVIIGAAILDTRYEKRFSVESVWRKVLTVHPEQLQPASMAMADDARLKWTTYNNLSQWFDDAKADVIASGLVKDQEVRDINDNLISEIDFGGEDVKRRFINMDETHHDLSITSEKGGPRSTMYHNPNYQRGYKPSTKAGRHVTGVYATNAAGEILPPMYIFDSSATVEDNFRVKVSWLEGLPSIEGRFGCPTCIESGSFFAVRSSGSMDDTLFNDYVDRIVLPLYPNISKTTKFDPVTGKKLRLSDDCNLDSF